MGKLDLSKFKKVRSSEKHTVLRHPEGHEITIFHKALSKPVKDQLDKLEMAEGGKVSTAGNPKLQQAYKKPDKEGALESKQHQEEMPKKFAQGGPAEDSALPAKDRTAGFKAAQKRVNGHMANEMQHFADGEIVDRPKDQDNTIQANTDYRYKSYQDPGPQQTQTGGNTSINTDVKKTMSNAFKFANGDIVDPQKAREVQDSFTGQKSSPPAASNNGVPASNDSGKSPEEAAHRQAVRASYGYAEGGDVSHAHLSEAIKNLTQKYSTTMPKGDNPIQRFADSPDTVQAAPQFNMTAPENIATNPSSLDAATQMSPADTTPASPTDPNAAPTGTLPEQAQKDVEAANAAETQIGKNTQESQKRTADIYGNQAQNMQALHQKYEELGNHFHQKFEDLSDQVEAGHIDPNGWWNNMNTGSKILTSIGMLFAGAGAGVSGHPEMISNILNKTIDRDIEAQKANLGNKQSLLGKYMEMYNSLPQAEAAARLTMNAGVEGLINQQAAKLGSANAMQISAMMKAKRRQDLLPQVEGLAKGQMMSQMYGGMGKPQSQAGGEEQAYQQQMQNMRILNPDLGKDMENKYLPNVGIARVPITDALREKMSAQSDLSSKLTKLEAFAKQHQGSFDPSVIAIGKTLAADAQQAARVAGHQGVYKESDQKFLENMIDPDPTKFLANMRTLPKYKTMREQNDSSLKTLFKSYGVKPFSGSSEPQSGNQTRMINGKQYEATPQGWKRVH